MVASINWSSAEGLAMHGSRLLSLAVLVTVFMSSRAALASIDAVHQVVVVEDGHLRVKSRWYGHVAQDAWEFAAPLPPGTRALDRGVTLTLDGDDQRVVGISFAERPQYPLVLELEIPWAAGDPILALPLPPDPGWQRVEVEGDHRLILDASTGLPMHTAGYYGPGDMRVRDRVRVDRRLDGRHPAGAAYLPGAVVSKAGGIPGRLESGATRRLGLGIAAGGAFVSGLLVLTVVFRRSVSAVEVEEAEAYLDAELRALTSSDSSETP